MLFNKNRKLALLRPPKVGTFTATKFLQDSGWKALGGPHEFLELYSNKYPNLLNYKVYCFFRNPLDRFESKILHIKQMKITSSAFGEIVEKNCSGKTVESISYEDVIELYPMLKERFRKLFIPQVAWFSHPSVCPLNFENFEPELRRIADNYETPFPWNNKSTDFGRSVITEKVRAFVRDYYAADYEFAKKALGKEY